ncbi:MAG: AbrB/MazE/SpoVT family DNA-binding domain-containing protein [Chloroflexi bacterium]|nr:AbrB/MazE/SpoVT family DNA-binding domain-containing protein [Chloroflexota bacterium]
MKAMVDAEGRLALPQEIQEAAGLQPGMALEAHWRDGRIEIEVAPLPVTLVRRGHFLVAVPDVPTEPLTAATVEATLKAGRKPTCVTW